MDGREKFALVKTVKGDFDTVLQRTRDSLKESKFGTLTEVDFQKAFKEKIGQDTGRSVQLGACDPRLAWQVYQKNKHNAALLPCHVCVIEKTQDTTEVVFTDPLALFSAFVADKDLQRVADEAGQRLKAAFERI